MAQTGGNFGHAVIWLIIGGFCELLSMLVIIWMILEYEVSFFTQHPFLTGFSIAGIGFGFSLVCVLYAMTPKTRTYHKKKGIGAQMVSKSPLYQLNTKIDNIAESKIESNNDPTMDEIEQIEK